MAPPALVRARSESTHKQQGGTHTKVSHALDNLGHARPQRESVDELGEASFRVTDLTSPARHRLELGKWSLRAGPDGE
jgi:hypothetical protein